MIFPGAFKTNELLMNLNLNDIKLKWPKEDLIFLKKIESTLSFLSLNNSFPKKNFEEIKFMSIFQFEVLDEL